jgi:hypothetical protein
MVEHSTANREGMGSNQGILTEEEVLVRLTSLN